MSKTEITAEPGIPLIVVTRDFDAPRDLVFRACTAPELLVQWLGPRDLTMTIDRYDICDGGRWRYVHTDSEGHERGDRLFEWYSDGDTPSRLYPSFRLSKPSAEFFDEFAGRCGAV